MHVFGPRLMFVAFVVDSFLSFPFLSFPFLFFPSLPFPFLSYLLFLLLCSHSIDSSSSFSPFVLLFMFLFSSFSCFCVLLLFVVFLQNKYFFLFDVFYVIIHALFSKSVAVSVPVYLANLYLLTATVEEQCRAISIR